MYEAFFNLRVKPFDLVPNPDFLFLSRSHRKALTYLDYGIRERVGFILLTGDIGSGKTTIIRNLIKKHQQSVLLAKIFNTRVDSEQLLAMINEEFGLAVQGRDKVALLRELNDFLIERYARDERPVLVIDEAQNLSAEILEEIRMLSNLETDNAKLLQIILVGQPELRNLIAGPEMTQLRQRISINCHLQPLNRQETESYILHRLETAGNRDAARFSEEAMDVIYRYSRGIPRLINTICDFFMLSAFAEQTCELDGAMARDIVGDLDIENQYWGTSNAVATVQAVGDETVESSQVARDDRMMNLLQDIHSRIETLESRVDQGSASSMGEFCHRLETLESSLNKHISSTVGTIEELKRDVKLVRPRYDTPPAVPLPEVPAQRGLIRRLFGG